MNIYVADIFPNFLFYLFIQVLSFGEVDGAFAKSAPHHYWQSSLNSTIYISFFN